MADSPAHKFGQNIGNLLEEIIESQLLPFCQARSLYLDKKGPRKARSGVKLTWEDKYGTQHDLDFVIENGGTEEKKGRPVAFIEAAWRRYTKHSRNKAQEIQGAVLPIFEKHHFDLPFIGVALAGIFTSGSLNQLKACGFKVLYFPYETITAAFQKIGLSVEFDESTPVEVFSEANSFIDNMSISDRNLLKSEMIKTNKSRFDAFIKELEASLDRVIEKILIIPLHGDENVFRSVSEAEDFLERFDESTGDGPFRHYEVICTYTNQDEIKASFKTKDSLKHFLNYINS